MLDVAETSDSKITFTGSFDLQFWEGSDLSDTKTFSGGSLSFNESQFTVPVTVFENHYNAGAYINEEQNWSNWEIPPEETLISLGTLVYTNDELENDFGLSAPNHGANFGFTLDSPVGANYGSNFYIDIINSGDGAENINIGYRGSSRTANRLQLRFEGEEGSIGYPAPIFLDYLGARPVGASEDTPLQTSFNVADDTTASFELYGRLFTTEALVVPVEITSISEDTGVEGDFRTSDNKLIFNGTAQPLSEVEVFIESDMEGLESPVSIGNAIADGSGNWSLDYTGVELVDGEYGLTATATDIYGSDVGSTNKIQLLEIDTNFDIELDFSDSSIANNQTLQDRIIKAAGFWEEIILNDIPDVDNPAVGGFVDDLKITFKVDNIDGNEGTLAETDDYVLRLSNTSGNIDPLTGQSISSFDYLPLTGVITIDEGDQGLFDSYRFEQTMQHEIAHAIGFNPATLEDKDLIKDITGNSGETYYGFTGNNALNAYHELGGELVKEHESVPLEDNDSNPGHWNEWLFPDGSGDEGYTIIVDLPTSEFPFFEKTPVKVPGFSRKDELMTTANPPGKDALVSKLTLGAFKDLGFTVDGDKSQDIDLYTSFDGFGLIAESPLLDIGY